MTTNDGEMLKVLEAHTDAWNAHDLDRLMELFSPDCVFEAAGGNEASGTTYAGTEVVRAAFADIYAAVTDAQWTDGRHTVMGHGYGVSEWLMVGTLENNLRLEIRGCDFLTVSNGLIVKKNSFTKDRPPFD
jgi:ketosteroid isomerase-like protein